MKKAILTYALFFFSLNYLLAQTLFQQNGLTGVKQNGKVMIPAKYRLIVPVDRLFLVTTAEKENKVIDINNHDIIAASQDIDVLYLASSSIFSVKPKGDSLFYLTDHKAKRISNRGYNGALTLFYTYPATSEYFVGNHKDTFDIFFKGKLISTRTSGIAVPGNGPMNNFLIIKEPKERNIIAIDTSGTEIAVTTGDEYLVKNNYLITSTLERTASGYPSFLHSVYDRNLKFVFQTKDFVEPINGTTDLFIRQKGFYGIVDTTQKILVPFKYNDYQMISINKSHYTIMRDDRGRWTMYNSRCEVLSAGIYFYIAGSENEYAIVAKQFGESTENLLYGLINSKAGVVIQCRFDKIEFDKEKRKYVFKAKGKVYEYGVEAIRSNNTEINSLVKPRQ